MKKKAWVIFHREDSRWACRRTRINGYVGGLPLVQLELAGPAVVLPDFLFETRGEAKRAARRRTLEAHHDLRGD